MVAERAEIPAIHHYKVNMPELLWGHGVVCVIFLGNK